MKRWMLILPVLVVAGCSNWSNATIRDASGKKVETVDESQRKQVADIIITEADISDRPYKVVGDIEVTVNKTTIFNADPTKEMVDEKLRERAASICADAVILVRYGTVGISAMSWGSLEGTGRAV